MHQRSQPFTIITCALLGFLPIAGCISLDPKADVQRAGGLTADRTGAAESYDPQADDLVAAKVDQLLADGLTVDEAVQVALLNNRGLQASFTEIGASRADVVQSQLLSNPTFSLSMMFPEGGGRSKLTVGMAQQIVDLWQIPVRKKVAEAQLEQTILKAAQQAVELAADVKRACYELLAVEQVIGVVRENHTLAEQSMDLVRRQFEAGQATQFDVNLARVDVLDVDNQLIQLDRDHQFARARLARLLGLARGDRGWKLKDKLPAPGSIPPERDLCEWAMRQRLDAEVAAAQVRAAEQEVRLQVLKVFPDFSLGFDLERMEDRKLPRRHILADTARDSVAAGKLTAPSIESRAQRQEAKRQVIDAILGPSMQITLPIFDQNQAQIAKAQYRAIQERKRFENLLDQVSEDVWRSTQGVVSGRQVHEFYSVQLLPQLQDNVQASRRIYAAGQQSVLALLEAQRTLVNRRKDAVNVLRDYALAMADLERAVGGRLPPATATAPAASAPNNTQGEK